jgi:hypothetical protein
MAGNVQLTGNEVTCVEIPLPHGLFALVDEIDAVWLSKWKWSVQFAPNTQSWYALRYELRDGKRKRIWMHRAILELGEDRRLHGEHINRCTLDNLRVATNAQNHMNQKVRRDSASGLKGVRLIKKTGKWRATIKLTTKRTMLGDYPTAELAHAAYCEAAHNHFGEFARAN